MPRTSGDAKHPLRLRLSFQQRSFLNVLLDCGKNIVANESDKQALSELQMAVANLTCQPGGCSCCTDDGPEIIYGVE